LVADEKGETQVLRIAQKLRSEAKQRTPVLVVVQGDEIGRRFLLNQRHLILGRDPKCADLAISDPSISSKHAMLQVDPTSGRFGVMDLGSRNGTFVNGVPAESSALREGDKIFLGRTVLKFTFLDDIEQHYHRQLDQLIHLDSLTGLYARRWFDHEYPKAFERARLEQLPFCVLMMDMDKLIKATIEPNGVGARFGGDEFVAFVHNAGIDEGLELAEEVRQGIEAFEFRREEIRVAPTISIGVAELEPGISRPEELTRLADDALYRAKKAGRNTVER
jgi:GGDEF domain-containing protein